MTKNIASPCIVMVLKNFENTVFKFQKKPFYTSHNGYQKKVCFVVHPTSHNKIKRLTRSLVCVIICSVFIVNSILSRDENNFFWWCVEIREKGREYTDKEPCTDLEGRQNYREGVFSNCIASFYRKSTLSSILLFRTECRFFLFVKVYPTNILIHNILLDHVIRTIISNWSFHFFLMWITNWK